MELTVQNEKKAMGWLLVFGIFMLSAVSLSHLSKSVREEAPFNQRTFSYEAPKQVYTAKDLLAGRHLEVKPITDEEMLLAENKTLSELIPKVPKEELHKYLKVSRVQLVESTTSRKSRKSRKSEFSCEKFNDDSIHMVIDYAEQFQHEACRIYKNRFSDEEINLIAYNATTLLLSTISQ